jgi:signal transduction histidine kinase
MTLRRFGLILLAAVGVVPLALAGFLMINRARETALHEIRTGNQRVAVRAASQLAQFADQQAGILKTLAAPLSKSARAAPDQVRRILKNYRIIYPNLRTLDIVGFGKGCHEAATSRIEEPLEDRCGQEAAERSLAGEVYMGPISLSSDFTPVMTMGAPLEIAGELLGGAIAEIDMVAIRETVKEIRVGTTGFARLVGPDGTLISHGEPEEMRRVFLREKDPYIDRIRAAPAGLGARYDNSQGNEVIALSATVPGLGWTVVVEQPISEAFRGANLMSSALAWTTLGAAIVAMLLGLLVGGPPLRMIKQMRAHAGLVAKGQLDSRITPLPRIKEIRELAVDLNRMTGELARLHDEIKSRERLNTFARVAAGLAHDLQTPIESVRGACDLMLAKPDDETALELLRSAAQNHLPRLHRYVRDLRRLAHDGKVPLELASVNPRALAERAAADAGTSPKWMGVEFVAEGEARGIWADESLLRRAVGNLVANAADACVMRRPPTGRVTIRVSDSADGGLLNVDVIDTGVGIPADKLADLLIHDFRSSKRNSGVGLGLGVARHVASSHGGTVTADSVEGQGSTFRITLPRQAVAGLAADQAQKGVTG